MKTSTIFCIGLLMAVSSLYAQEVGIKFYQGDWKSALELARTEKKTIFIDAYTTWCGPCKRMTADVFTQKSVGDFFNANFINMKIDMEKGEGPTVGRTYEVQAYPTYLFVDGDGELVHRGLGYLPAPNFIDLGMQAIDPTANLKATNKKVEQNTDPEFLHDYALQRLQQNDGTHLVAAKMYLNTQTDWLSVKNKQFIYQVATNPEGDLFKYIVENRAAFQEQFGEQVVKSFIDKQMNTLLNNTTKLEKKADLDTLIELIYPTQAARLKAKHDMTWARQRGDRNGYGEAAIRYFKQYNDNAEELSDAVWTVNDNIENADVQAEAVKWGKRSVKLDNAYYNHDALAWLYYKMEQPKKALKEVKKAKKAAAKTGEDTSSVDKLLKQLEN